jgi:alginate O-acetyltransferase complex protein AlgJ
MKRSLLVGLMIFWWVVAVPNGDAGETAQRRSAEAFRERCRDLGYRMQIEQMEVVRGIDGWLFLTKELVHIGKGVFWGERAKTAGMASNEAWRDPIPAILDFAEQLKKHGVQLILMPVPPKVVIYPDRLWRDARVPEERERLDAVHAEFYALLRKNGIDVLDLTPVFTAARQGEGEPLYCQTDSHWSGTGIQVAARAAVARIRERLKESDRSAVSMKATESRVTFSGDLVRLLGASSESEARMLRRVTDAAGMPLSPDEASGVLILADSHGLAFHAGGDMHAEGAGLFEQVSFELGYPVDLIAVRGSGATPARINLLRKIQRDPGYLQRKKIVLWCFSAREFTESDGWRIVPLGPTGAAAGKHQP